MRGSRVDTHPSRPEPPMLSLAIRQLRTEKGYSQEELGDRLGVSKMTISRWEASDPPDNRVSEIAGALEISVTHLRRLAAGLNARAQAQAETTTFVRSDAGINAWRNAIALAGLDPHVALILATLPAFLDAETGVVVVTTAELYERANLPPEWVQTHLPAVVDSPWVDRIGRVEWVFTLTFPPEFLQKNPL
ncbi:XRE family transcriptional regulator [Bradymonadaceae bacterium TMQ3]|nr:XRE family transcriptional regulator [Bradymonadaceae bacterium TMQ3]TXC67609.1 helix-turn-helix transcriptional regulator [Bradymonadales bacterium TMQ1]